LQQEDKMKKIWMITLVLTAFTSMACIKQTIHHDVTFLDQHTWGQVWRASIRAVNDIGFTIDSLDRDAGFIGAESGTHIGQDVPPRLSIMISKVRGRVFVECKMLQKEQFIDIFGHGRRTIHNFMTALNLNLNQ
jgi:hypothetical protein